MSGSGEERVRVKLRIRGRVQGVFFRQSTKQEADRLGVEGWVQNLPDGSVEAVAEGPAEAVERLVRFCQLGPPGARVDAVEREALPPGAEFQGFAVRR